MENDGVLEGWQIIFHIRRSRKKIRWTEWRSKIISTVENKTLEQSLSVVKWNYANQTVKILSRLFYEQTNSIEKYEWVETKEEGLENLPSQKDFKKLEEIIVGVASYLTCFEIATEEQKVDDSQYSQEIFDVLLNEIGLTELNPLLDKILAYAVIVFINTSNNLKDVEANVKKLGEGVQSILKAFNQFAEDSNYKANNSDRANSLYDIDTSALEIGMVIKNYKELCRLLNQEVKSELIKSYGNDILNGENIDRKKLGEIVFNSRLEMKNLSDITWKYMQIEIDKFLIDNKDKIIILDWLLLPISKYFDKCDVKLLLDIPYEVRKERAIKRDNITEEAFDLREKASISFDINKFDYVINDNNKVEIKRLVKLIWQKFYILEVLILLQKDIWTLLNKQVTCLMK